MEPGALQDLPKLETLILTKNGISRINRGTIKNLPSLQKVKLNDNLIQELEEKCIKLEKINSEIKKSKPIENKVFNVIEPKIEKKGFNIIEPIIKKKVFNVIKPKIVKSVKELKVQKEKILWYILDHQ